MQKARGHPSSGLPQLVSIRFQVLFTPLIGVLFIIQSPYWFTIGRPGVLSLGGWTPHVHAEFHEHRATLGLASYCSTGLSPSVVDLSRSFTQLLVYPLSLAATYGVAFCFPFLRLLRCFSSPGSLLHLMHSGASDPYGPGFPIRKSSDQSLVTGSPRHIAGSNVLHRLWTRLVFQANPENQG